VATDLQVTLQVADVQNVLMPMAAIEALQGSHFAQKFNANLSQIFESTAIRAKFFMIFLLTIAICHSL